MDDKEIAKTIRESLRSKFPDTVFQVTVSDGAFTINTFGGLSPYEYGLSKREAEFQMMDCVWESLPEYDYYLHFDEDNL